MASAHPSSRNDEYVVLKIYVHTPPGKVNREIFFYNHLNTISTSHPGSQHIRHAIDMFSLERASGDIHKCSVHLPLQTTLFEFQRLGGKARPLPEELVKSIMKYLLEALDFLHTEANVTHCGM
jgi:serine/threonine protein kinase